MMFLKKAIGPAFVAAIPILPTIMFRNLSRKRYYQAYVDAGLLQTSLLDMWDTSFGTAMEKREEFRRFLVDAHKAAYIPVCIAGVQSTILTAEPAVVIPLESDLYSADLQTLTKSSEDSSRVTSHMEEREDKYSIYRSPADHTESNAPSVLQHGVSFRRTTNRPLFPSDQSTQPMKPGIDAFTSMRTPGGNEVGDDNCTQS